MVKSEKKVSWSADKKKIILRVRDEFTPEEIKSVYNNQLKPQLTQTKAKLKQMQEIKFMLEKMQKEPRTKELMEMIYTMLNAKPHDMENIKAGIKHMKESIAKIEKEIDMLKPYIPKEPAKPVNTTQANLLLLCPPSRN